jgi:hypothetical protein
MQVFGLQTGTPIVFGVRVRKPTCRVGCTQPRGVWTRKPILTGVQSHTPLSEGVCECVREGGGSVVITPLWKRLVDRAIKLKEKTAEERAKKTLFQEKRQVKEAERAQKKK